MNNSNASRNFTAVLVYFILDSQLMTMEWYLNYLVFYWKSDIVLTLKKSQGNTQSDYRMTELSTLRMQRAIIHGSYQYCCNQ